MKKGTAAMLAAAAACAVAAAASQAALRKISPSRAPVVRQGVFSALGGLRSLASEAVWFRAERLQSRCRFAELAHLASILTFLEPHEPEVWIYSAWNLAYNVSVKMPSLEDRWPWVAEAVRLLRDRGLAWNPGDPKLCRELAYLFEIKIGADSDAASPIYRREWRKAVEAATASGDWGSLGMDPARMRETMEESGMNDVADPEFSAFYWAREGLRSAGPADRPFLLDIQRLSKIIYARRHAQGA